MAYTQGEWTAYKDATAREACFVDVKHIAGEKVLQEIAIVYHLQDAHLIAASKEMYAALKLYKAHQKGTHGHYCTQCEDVITKALAKAEAKQ